ncbi:MAG: APC family permease [Myxococcaceae bacterium]
MNKTLTPFSAILLALMTMIGGGLFVNPRQLAETLGALSPFAYVLASLLMFPLILTIADLTRLQPLSGGLYVYSKQYIGSFAGFLSGWTYFLAKSTSAAFLLHTVNSFFISHVDFLAPIHPLLLDGALIALLTLLHIIGVSINSRIKYLFAAIKLTPLIFGLFAGFYLFNSDNFDFNSASLSLEQACTAIPVCLYALIGFEVVCSIGGFIENPTRNIKRTIIIAFCIVSIITVLLQIAFFGSLGAGLSGTREPMLALGSVFFGNNLWLAKLVNSLVFASITGGAFFMLGSNCWNLVTLAQNNHLPFKRILTKVNKYNSPWVSLLLQGLTSFTMISITTQQLALQNMVIFSIFSCFLMNSIAAISAGRSGLLQIPSIVPVLAIGTCAYVIGLCFINMLQYGVSFSFLSFFSVGILTSALISLRR